MFHLLSAYRGSGSDALVGVGIPIYGFLAWVRNRGQEFVRYRFANLFRHR